MFLGSSCIYPKRAPQPLREGSVPTGPLELSNEPYAIAKIAAIKMVEAYRSQYGSDFISVMPTNLYGPGDNYHPERCRVRRRADPPLPRGEGRGRAACRGVGHRHTAQAARRQPPQIARLARHDLARGRLEASLRSVSAGPSSRSTSNRLEFCARLVKAIWQAGRSVLALAVVGAPQSRPLARPKLLFVFQLFQQHVRHETSQLRILKL